MNIVHVSDIHDYRDLVLPECDIAICSGDVVGHGTKSQMNKFVKWFSQQPATHRLYVPGNHDKPVFEEFKYWQGILGVNGITILEDSATEIEGIKFYGMPWMPAYGNWSYMLPRESDMLSKRVEEIPEDTQVLITHCPPQGILDFNEWDSRIGCAFLRARVDKIKPVLHCFGHIHGGHGIDKPYGSSTVFSNAAIMDERYYPVQDFNRFVLDTDTLEVTVAE